MNGTIDVVIAGAGPVGLLLAIELALGGARVLVLERRAAVNPTIKALSIGPLGAEALQRRGMGAALDAAEKRNASAMQAFTQHAGKPSNISGHFAGLPLIRKDAQKEPWRRNRMVTQQDLEAMLGDHVRALGIDVRRECDITGIVQDDDGVQVAWQSPTGAETARCSWLAGCDGGRSSIRKMAGFAFPGTAPTSTMFHAMVTIDHPEQLLPFGWQRTPRGVFAYGPFPGRLFMIDFAGTPPDRDAPVTCEELDTLLRHISGKDVHVTDVSVANRWTDNTRLADTYRTGRVLLAGDAAHIHSPFGGQGLSLGLVDAANLGWKLAAVVRNAAPATLLDTYTAERRPVAEAVLANTLAQLAILRPDPQSGAMRDLVATLMQDDGANRIIGEAMSGLGARYALGATHDAVGRLIGDGPVRFQGQPAMLYDLMQDGSAVLLAATADDAVMAHAGKRAIRCATIDTGPSLLVRPDGCVAWAGAGMEGLDDALHTALPELA